MTSTISKLKKVFMAGAVALPLLFGMSSAQAAPIGLALVIDGSGSINSTNFQIQKNGYVAALNSILPSFFGQIAVGVYQFSTNAQTEFAFQEINDATDLANLTNAITGMSRLGGNTAIGRGINLAASDMNAFGFGNLQKAVIDVSTDGNNNVNPTPGPAAQDFVNAAAATLSGEGNVNCLGIGASANCDFIAGLNSFSISSNDFNIQAALETKLRRELSSVPEPAALLLFGFGLAGLGMARRRKFA